MKFSAIKAKLPSVYSSLLALLSAILLILAFPDFELWFLAYIALIPLLFAIEREKDSFIKSFITGWIFGIAFFAGSCWWITYAPVVYGGIPTILVIPLLFGAAAILGLFPALFGGIVSMTLKRFGTWGILFAPFIWTTTEFLRFWLTGNNWNAIAYSQAFNSGLLEYASVGGIYLTSFLAVLPNALITSLYLIAKSLKSNYSKENDRYFLILVFFFPALAFGAQLDEKSHYSKITRRMNSSNNFKGKIVISIIAYFVIWIAWGFLTDFSNNKTEPFSAISNNYIIAIQPNVPMSSIGYTEWKRLRDRHVQLAEIELKKIPTRNSQLKTIVVFPESPMNFGYTHDRDFQAYLKEFTEKNNVQVLFNAAEPADNNSYYNSAVLVDEKGEKIAQYDKIHLVPFGEYVPLPEPLSSIVPSMVGNFEKGKEYDIFPLGDAKAGIMICFESHFPTLSRQFALEGADVLVEMTNDGYLGETPVLRQHLANAVFRAVETNRPVLRVTNVGITAYINERGEVLEPSKPYTEETRGWSVAQSNGSQTFYVKYGDWFAWLCSIVSLAVLFLSFSKRKVKEI